MTAKPRKPLLLAAVMVAVLAALAWLGWYAYALSDVGASGPMIDFERDPLP